MPINLSGTITPEKVEFVNSNLPYQFIDKFARVVITTVKNEHLLKIKDLMVVFDVGINESDIFNINQSSIHFVESLSPKSVMIRHHQLLERYQDTLYIEFKPNDAERPNFSIPLSISGDISSTLLALRNFGISYERMQNLPSEPSHVLVDDCLSLLKRIGIIDTKAENGLTAAGRKCSKSCHESKHEIPLQTLQ